jgi:chromosome segregation ATPase
VRLLKDKQTSLEKKISETEAEISRLEKTLSTPALYGNGNHTRLTELGATLEEAKENLSGLMQQWEEITDKLENI